VPEALEHPRSAYWLGLHSVKYCFTPSRRRYGAPAS
jgi:hypothetical protein